MATISKFHQVTNFILLEHKTDQYAALNRAVTPEADRTNIYMYQTLTGKQGCLDMRNFTNTAFPDEIEDDYYFPGIWDSKDALKNPPLFVNSVGDSEIKFKNEANTGTGLYKNQNTDAVATILPSGTKELCRQSSCLYDTIRLYLTVGYVLNSVHGILIKVEGEVKQVLLVSIIDSNIPIQYRPPKYHKVNTTLTLLDWFMPKSELPNKVKFLPTPLYFNSKFYDRYIEIKVPSVYDLAINGPVKNIDYLYDATFKNPFNHEDIPIRYRGFIDISSPGIISVATISDDYVTYHNQNINEITYSHDAYTKIPITFESNSKYFNVELKEDTEYGIITYQPVYGEPTSTTKMRPFDIYMMQQIELGEIPMFDKADAESVNDGMDDFIENYGVDAYKWCIVNELSVTYYYDYITESDRDNSPTIEPYTEYFTNTIDYTGKTTKHGEFWVSKFMPYILDRPMMYCTKIGIRYTAHLYNRMNNREVCRTASMIISDPMKYKKTVINTAMINSYKVVNKIVQNSVEIVKPDTSGSNTGSSDNTYIPNKYVSILDIEVRINNDTVTYQQGTGTMRLTKGPQLYLFQFYQTDNQSNSRTIYAMNEAGKDYKITFPLANAGEKIEFKTVSDLNGADRAMGKLMFFISGAEAQRIMGFTGEHIFMITEMSSNNKVPDAIIYTGKVDWLWT